MSPVILMPGPPPCVTVVSLPNVAVSSGSVPAAEVAGDALIDSFGERDDGLRVQRRGERVDAGLQRLKFGRGRFG